MILKTKRLILRQCREDDAEERCIAAGLTPEQYRLIAGGESGQIRYRVRFKLLELLDDVVGRLRQWRG